jgi:hypothetical protein
LPQGIKKINDMELQSYIPSNGNGHIWMRWLEIYHVISIIN